jgi:hypothetical protein
MSVRPVLLKDLRRTAIENHQQNLGKGSYNRFETLSPRPRAPSLGKRPRSEDFDYSQAPKTPKLDSNTVFTQLDGNDTVLDEIRALVAELELHNANPELPPDPRLACISKIVIKLAKCQGNLSSAVIDTAKLAAPDQGKQKAVVTSRVMVTNLQPPSVEISPEEAQKKKVKQVLKDAEKKTVIFNLNLGTSQMMNKDSISRKVTMTLGDIVKKGEHDYHIGDAEDVIDDILSCSKLEFLGNTTKKYFNNRNLEDPKNNTMYTIPVRFDFKDKDYRISAENSLRKLCKVNCSVPYPKKLRVMLGELVKEGRKKFPDKFIRTRVNSDQLTIEAHARTDSGWFDLELKKPIPLNILDSNSSQVSSMDTMDIMTESQDLS